MLNVKQYAIGIRPVCWSGTGTDAVCDDGAVKNLETTNLRQSDKSSQAVGTRDRGQTGLLERDGDR